MFLSTISNNLPLPTSFRSLFFIPKFTIDVFVSHFIPDSLSLFPFLSLTVPLLLPVSLLLPEKNRSPHPLPDPTRIFLLFQHIGTTTHFVTNALNLSVPMPQWITSSPAPSATRLPMTHIKFRFWVFVYLCHETFLGVELLVYHVLESGVLVVDMSSNFFSKPMDMSKFGVICVGAGLVIHNDSKFQHASPLFTPNVGFVQILIQLPWTQAITIHSPSYKTIISINQRKFLVVFDSKPKDKRENQTMRDSWEN
ncbi:60S ribosomal protein L22-2 isoform D [Glycine soja]|uniref:60S ribosomal protein L22-2 isoform C n=1 Tax=Glycine soja TaxID=3848 RepID=A0A445FKI0_GLYSO|nr:60S ribosomal protein L22-2 isoform C [Glycine soja]RZB49367.1 60S ribosomal protein L22-2 isoform D [Glycine soja]